MYTVPAAKIHSQEVLSALAELMRKHTVWKKTTEDYAKYSLLGSEGACDGVWTVPDECVCCNDVDF